MNDKVFEEVIGFIITERGKYRFPLTSETRLLEDLGIDGDDAVEFFEAFQEKFQVDLSDLNLGKYFNDEGLDILGILTFFRKIFSKEKKLFIDKKDQYNAIDSLKIRDLEQCKRIGRWQR